MSCVKFFNISQQQYDNLSLKDPDALYFIYDTKAIYKGSDLATACAVINESAQFPSEGVPGTIYFSAQGDEIRLCNPNGNGQWLTVSFAKTQSITGTGSASEIPSTRAVVNFVNAKVAEVSAGVAISEMNDNIIQSKSDGIFAAVEWHSI